MTTYPPSTLAYPLLNQLLDSSLPFPVSSTSSTFTLPIVATPSSSFPSCSSSASPTVVSVTSSNVASLTSYCFTITHFFFRQYYSFKYYCLNCFNYICLNYISIAFFFDFVSSFIDRVSFLPPSQRCCCHFPTFPTIFSRPPIDP